MTETTMPKTETPGAALLRIHWRGCVEPHLSAGASDPPDYRLLPENVRDRWEGCAHAFAAWLRTPDGGDGEPSGS